MPSRPKIEYGEEDLRELIQDDIKRRYGWHCPDVDVEFDLGTENRWFATLPDSYAEKPQDKFKTKPEPEDMPFDPEGVGQYRG